MSSPEPGPGHNSKNATGDQLKSIIERIERLEEEKKVTSDDIKDVYTEAGSNGFDKKAIRKIVALRKKDKATVQEENEVLSTYLHAIGQEYLA